MDGENWARGVDPYQPTAARMYDYYLGGSHNFAADREAALGVLAAMPAVRQIAIANRAFLTRAVRYLVGEGVRQFLDLGSGIPTVGNVHEVAQHAAPDARVAYVDIDPVAVMHGRRILAENAQAASILGDLRSPQELLALLTDRTLGPVIDLDRPIGLLIVSVLHFVPGDEAYDAVAQLRDALAPGSYLVVAHGAAEGFDQAEAQAVQGVYRSTTTPGGLRTREQIAAFFDGLKLIDPGLVWAPEWRPAPEDPDDFAADPQRSGILAAVGRKPE
jgi:SAM-dependent methyltransferase